MHRFRQDRELKASCPAPSRSGGVVIAPENNKTLQVPSDIWASKVVALFVDALLRTRIGRYS